MRRGLNTEMAFRELKAALRAIDHTFGIDRISEVDVLKNGTELQEKVDQARKMEDVYERLQKCRSAGQVFLEFSVDAAAAKVEEMLFSRTSGDRQRAQETVLGYGLGKPINRNMSMTMNVSDASEEELEHDIRRLLFKLNFAPGKREAGAIFIGTRTEPGCIETKELPAEQGVSRELHQEHKED